MSRDTARFGADVKAYIVDDGLALGEGGGKLVVVST
jgi:hypothetical protein